MQFFVAFVATLACAFAAPSAYGAYGPYPYAAPAYGGRFANDPPAPISVLPNGFLADTPEVASARAAHLAEKARVASYPYAGAVPAPYVAPYVAPYAGPYASAYAYGPAQITVLPSGYLADTPEVAASKAASAVARASAAAAAAASPEYGSYPYAAPYYAGAYAHAAAPVTVLPSGFLADTPEVAAAKAAHFAEVAKASAAAAASPDHGSYPYAAPYYYGHHY